MRTDVILLAITLALTLTRCISLPGSTPPTSVPASATEAAQPAPKPSACVAYTREQEAAIGAALAALPHTSPLIGAIGDYHNLRISDGCKGAK
jgi:hypothetical protein